MNRLFAFVLMPFSQEFDDIYQLGIKAAAEAADILAERLDNQVFYQESMLDWIYNEINRADIIIADMTGRNPNVFYEVGYAHAKQKKCVLLTSKTDDIPFDLKHYRHIIYGKSISDLKKRLTSDLQVIKERILHEARAIEVTMRPPDSSLFKQSYWAEGRAILRFDFNNKSDRASSDIDAIYLYSDRGWSYSVDGHQCPATDSDITGFAQRHFVRSPTRRLERNGWAQVKLEGVKLLEYQTQREAVRDHYQNEERYLIRVVAADKTLDFEFKATLDFREAPSAEHKANA